jgi:hypothetical protein
MAMRPDFTQTHSDLNTFLHAKIGEDKSGLVVTVASAIARSGEDPWKEAERLARLAPAAAADVLMPMIARSAKSVDAGDARAAADRLIGLLPKWLATEASRPTVTSVSSRRTGPSTAAVWMLFVALAIAVLFWAIRSPAPTFEQDPTGTPWSSDAPNDK